MADRVTVLPEGIDVEVMKTGGLGGLFFSIDHARFIYRQLLAAPRLASSVHAVAPQIEGKLLYARTASGREIAGAGERRDSVANDGGWRDAADRRPARGRTMGSIARGAIPSPNELRQRDRSLSPPAGGSARGDPTWAEWHYFNVLSADRSTMGVHLADRRRGRAEWRSGAARCW